MYDSSLRSQGLSNAAGFFPAALRHLAHYRMALAQKRPAHAPGRRENLLPRIGLRSFHRNTDSQLSAGRLTVSQDLLALAKQRLPLSALMAQLGFGDRAKKSARCPFHDDSAASFSLYI